MVISNATGFANSSVYVYAVSSGVSLYLQNDGSLAPIGSTPIPALTLAASGDTIVPLPYMQSARVYFSVNTPLRISKGALPGFGSNVTQLYDWIELNYAKAGNGTGSLFINTTQVDMFGLPITMRIDWPGGSKTVGIPSGLRNTIMAAMRADQYLKNLIVTVGGVDLRVMAPNHGIDAGLIPTNYLDAYIDAVWTYYQTHTMTYAPGVGGTWTAAVVNGALVFTQGSQTVSVPKPTSSQAIGVVSTQGGNGGAISPFMTAGLNRGTLLSANQPDNNPTDFYQVTPTNLYSAIIHRYSLNNLAYGFSYDDYGGFSSTVAPPTTPSAITVTLNAF